MINRRVAKIAIVVVVISCGIWINGCQKDQTAVQNSKMVAGYSDQQTTQTAQNEENQTAEDTTYEAAVKKETSIYNCDIEADKAAYSGRPDIVVGDNLYATQINDWYINPDQYLGKVIEIEGYYIGDFAPYDFVGRYGPTCPYCQGGYVCFEFLSNEDLSGLESGKDWIKVTGILREGQDGAQPFYYLEVLSLEKLDQVGQDTVVN